MFRIRILVRPTLPKTPPKIESLSKPSTLPPKTALVSIGLLTISEILSLSPTETNGIIDTCIHFIRKI